MAKLKGEFQGDNGDVLYPHTAADVVFMEDGSTVEQSIKNIDVSWDGISSKPESFPPNPHTHSKSQITDFPTSLPANGGNADTVDGKHASDFLNKTQTTHQEVASPICIGSATDNVTGWRPFRTYRKINNDVYDVSLAVGGAGSGAIEILKNNTLNTRIDMANNDIKIGSRYVLGEIDSLKSSVGNGKAQVANAITAKGVATSINAEFATMATNIGKIVTAERELLVNDTTTCAALNGNWKELILNLPDLGVWGTYFYEIYVTNKTNSSTAETQIMETTGSSIIWIDHGNNKRLNTLQTKAIHKIKCRSSSGSGYFHIKIYKTKCIV